MGYIITGWIHLVIIYNNTLRQNNLKCFVNGQLKGEESKINNHSKGSADSELYVGRYVWAMNYFKGIIDEIRFYNRALTETEIFNLYQTNY